MHDLRSNSPKLRDLLSFEVLISRRVVTIFYWFALLIIFIGALLSGGLIAAIVALVLGIIPLRMLFEFYIMLFKIEEHLDHLRSNAFKPEN